MSVGDDDHHKILYLGRPIYLYYFSFFFYFFILLLYKIVINKIRTTVRTVLRCKCKTRRRGTRRRGGGGNKIINNNSRQPNGDAFR